MVGDDEEYIVERDYGYKDWEVIGMVAELTFSDGASLAKREADFGTDYGCAYFKRKDIAGRDVVQCQSALIIRHTGTGQVKHTIPVVRPTRVASGYAVLVEHQLCL